MHFALQLRANSYSVVSTLYKSNNLLSYLTTAFFRFIRRSRTIIRVLAIKRFSFRYHWIDSSYRASNSDGHISCDALQVRGLLSCGGIANWSRMASLTSQIDQPSIKIRGNNSTLKEKLAIMREYTDIDFRYILGFSNIRLCPFLGRLVLRQLFTHLLELFPRVSSISFAERSIKNLVNYMQCAYGVLSQRSTSKHICMPSVECSLASHF